MKSTETRILSIQIPALCPLACAFCRTPNHDKGNPEKILGVVRQNIGKYDQIYITSNGETGYSTIFDQLVSLGKEHNCDIAVLCATERSVVPGLCRVEISLNSFTEPLALRAIERAKALGIPTIISMVDTGASIDEKAVAEKYGVDGVLVRSLQAEGLSTKMEGSTRWFTNIGKTLTGFPVAAYRELVNLGTKTTCINHNGDFVPLLGSA